MENKISSKIWVALAILVSAGSYALAGDTAAAPIKTLADKPVSVSTAAVASVEPVSVSTATVAAAEPVSVSTAAAVSEQASDKT